MISLGAQMLAADDGLLSRFSSEIAVTLASVVAAGATLVAFYRSLLLDSRWRRRAIEPSVEGERDNERRGSYGEEIEQFMRVAVGDRDVDRRDFEYARHLYDLTRAMRRSSEMRRDRLAQYYDDALSQKKRMDVSALIAAVVALVVIAGSAAMLIAGAVEEGVFMAISSAVPALVSRLFVGQANSADQRAGEVFSQIEASRAREDGLDRMWTIAVQISDNNLRQRILALMALQAANQDMTTGELAQLLEAVGGVVERPE